MTFQHKVGRAAALMALVCLVAPDCRPTAAAQSSIAATSTSLAGIPIAEYQKRRKALMASLPDGIVVLRASVEEEFGEVGRFRQNNNFMYLTGVETPAAYLMLNPFAPEGSREVLYLPARNMQRERWTGIQIGPGAEAASKFGFEDVRDAAKLDDEIRDALGSNAVVERARSGQRIKVYTEMPTGEDSRFSRERALFEHIIDIIGGRHASSIDVANVSYAIGELRRIKSPAEVQLLQKAIDITGDAQREVARTSAPGRFEYEVESVILAAFLRGGALRAGFPSIVGSGLYSTILHYNLNSKKMDEGDLVVVDIGAEYNFYTADITRTYPVSGTFTPRQREIYQLVLDTQEAAQKAYKPGMNQRDIHNVAVEFIKNSPIRDKAGKTVEGYFIHGLGHYLGMDVHDVGAYGTPLKPGDVITIEPGIYIQDEKLGVRIEDDYLVTDSGLVKLSKDIPSTVADIERAMREGRTAMGPRPK